MSDLREIKTIIRTDAVARLLEALREAGVARVWVSHVHSIGSGVDPKDLRVSFEAGGTYTEKAKLEFVAPASEVEALTGVIRRHGGAGHRGDGVVLVTDVAAVVNVRTGDRDRLALL
jgi:nitrogen regulatory protein PII